MNNKINSIVENYFKITNILKNKEILNKDSIKRNICNNILAGKITLYDEIKEVYNYYIVNNTYDLSKIIKDLINYFGNNCDLNWINTSLITDMSYLFYLLKDFNGDISLWDVSNVINMEGMFEGCKNFNSDISAWNILSVKNMEDMFAECENFNIDISSWNTINVENIANIFYHCNIKNEYKPIFIKFKKYYSYE